MVTMENSDEILQILERFSRLKQKEIPKELEDYLQFVAKTGDTIFKWSSLKYLFREKLLSVIKHFNEDSQRLEGNQVELSIQSVRQTNPSSFCSQRYPTIRMWIHSTMRP